VGSLFLGGGFLKYITSPGAGLKLLREFGLHHGNPTVQTPGTVAPENVTYKPMLIGHLPWSGPCDPKVCGGCGSAPAKPKFKDGPVVELFLCGNSSPFSFGIEATVQYSRLCALTAR
jgi:hypothetical protein